MASYSPVGLLSSGLATGGAASHLGRERGSHTPGRSVFRGIGIMNSERERGQSPCDHATQGSGDSTALDRARAAMKKGCIACGARASFVREYYPQRGVRTGSWSVAYCEDCRAFLEARDTEVRSPAAIRERQRMQRDLARIRGLR